MVYCNGQKIFLSRMKTDENKLLTEISTNLGHENVDDSLMDLEKVSTLAESMIDLCVGKSVTVQARWNPPPSLEGKSCLYVLKLGK